MTFVYLDRELNGNENPTGFYRISIDKNRKFSWVGNPSKLVPFHSVEVAQSQKVKTDLLQKFNRYRTEDRVKGRDWLELSQDQRDEVKIVMNDYKERPPELSDERYYPSFHIGDIIGHIPVIFLGIALVVFVVIRMSENTLTSTGQSNYGSISLAKYEGIIDASSLGSKFANVRSAPSQESDVVKVLKNGEKIVFSEQSKGWVHIMLDNGSEGWMASNLIKNKKKKFD